MTRTLDQTVNRYPRLAKPIFSSKPCEEATPLLGGRFGDPASSQGFCFWSRQVTKKKSECTPEEWAAIRERARVKDAEHRATPGRRAYMKEYMATYTKTPEYREKDNARYSEVRRQQQLSRMRARAYGVQEHEVEMLRAAQGNRCAICGTPFLPPAEGKKHGAECLDHCHATKKVRGLLCRMCNTFEGFLSKKGLTAAEYAARLQRYLDNPPASGLELVE